MNHPYDTEGKGKYWLAGGRRRRYLAFIEKEKIVKAVLMKSTSGVRGIVGVTLDPPTVIQYAAAFGQFLKKGRVVVGRDSRPSGEYISGLICSTLAMVGCDVVDIGVVPTPTVELSVLDHKAAGGIAVTASHNPSEWNALKFFGPRGEFITKAQYERLEAIVGADKPAYVPYNRLGSIHRDHTAVERHMQSVLKLKSLAVPKVRQAGFLVVVDAINGAGSYCLPKLLEQMGVGVIRLNCKGNGDFCHTPEPIPENLKQLGQAVRESKADLGLACDPDADRLALVDEAGRPIGEEMTLALAVAYYLRREKGPVAVNLSTSRMTADVARMVGCPVSLSPVGEANVIAEMRKRKAVIGGEGNGGVILPESHYGRDALVAAALVLSSLAETGKSLSEMAGALPAYVMTKKKSPLPAGFERKIGKVEKELKGAYREVAVDRRDGVRIDIPDGWVQVRKSNTEPIYRLIVEARSKNLADRLVRMVQKALR